MDDEQQPPDLYEQAWRAHVRQELERLREGVRHRLRDAGRLITDAAVDECLRAEWHRLPEPLVDALWERIEKRARARRRRAKSKLAFFVGGTGRLH